jgi:hypothetical protein
MVLPKDLVNTSPRSAGAVFLRVVIKALISSGLNAVVTGLTQRELQPPDSQAQSAINPAGHEAVAVLPLSWHLQVDWAGAQIAGTSSRLKNNRERTSIIISFFNERQKNIELPYLKQISGLRNKKACQTSFGNHLFSDTLRENSGCKIIFAAAPAFRRAP